MTHDCASCPACLHEGYKCCGCYDGACCQDSTAQGDDYIPDDLSAEEMRQFPWNAMLVAEASHNVGVVPTDVPTDGVS